MDGFPLTALDLVVIAIVALSAIVALARGLVRELFGFIAWIGAIVVAWMAFPHVRPMAREVIGNDILADLAAALGVFLVLLIGLRIIGNLIAGGISGSGLGALDRILGLAFGLARGALLVCVAYFLGSLLVLPERQPAWVKQAQLLPTIQAGTRFVSNLLPESVEERVRAAMNPGATSPAAGEKGYTQEERKALEQLLPRN